MNATGRDEQRDVESWLESRLEAIAAGELPVERNASELPERVSSRLKRAVACARLLRRVWPQAPLDAAVQSENVHTQTTLASLSAEFDGQQISSVDANSAVPLMRRLGRFEIRRTLGSGGNGIVFLAHDPVLDRFVALKLPRPEVLVTPESRSRFLREAQAAARLDHPNLVAVHETGEIGPLCYIASAYCDGPTLAQWLKEQHEPVNARSAAELIATIADAVEHIHSRRILHRDLKPSNILLAVRNHSDSRSAEPADGEFVSPGRSACRVPLDELRPLVADYGLAKLLEHDGDATRTGTTIGTPAYMAPEQAESRLDDIGPQSDVFSLGVILYELLTGRPPFRGRSDMETLRQVTGEEPRPPRDERPEISRDMDSICLKCLEKNPARRYATAADLADDLRRFLRNEPTSARPVGVCQRLVKWSRRRPAAATAVGVAAAAAIILVAVMAWHNVKLSQSLIVTEQMRERAEREQLRLSRHLYAADMRLAYDLWRSSDVARSLDILDRYIPRDGNEDHRSFAWFYLRRLCRAERLSLREHSGDVYFLAYSPDGESVASASKDGTIKIWDNATGRVQATLVGHEGNVNWVGFSPDGYRLASCGNDRTARIWDRETGTELSSLPHDEASFPLAVIFDPEPTKLLVLNPSGRLSVVEASDDSRRVFFSAQTGRLNDVAFSADGRLIATVGDDRSIRVWDATTGTERYALRRFSNAVQTAAFSPDGRYLAITADMNAVVICDAATGDEIRRARAHTAEIQFLAFSPDGKLLASAGDTTVRLWTVPSCEPVNVFPTDAGGAWKAIFSPDGRTVASSYRSGRVMLWDATERPYGMRLGNEGDFKGIRLSPDVEQVATTTKDGRVLLWDTATASISDTLSNADAVPFGGGLGFSRDNSHLIMSTRPREVQIRSRASGELLADLHLPFEVSPPPIFLPDGKLIAAAGHDGTVQLVEWATAGQKAIVRESSLAVHPLDVSPSGATIVWCDADGWLRAWATDLGRLLATTKIGSRVQCLAISDDDQFVATGQDENKIAIWELGKLQHVEDLVGPTIGINVLAFCPDGKTLAAGDATGSVVLWDWVTKQQLITLLPGKTEGAPGPITALKFSSDGHTLAAVTGGSEPRVFRWSAPRSIR